MVVVRFMTVFAAVIAVTKDLPDTEGDIKFNVNTFAAVGLRACSLPQARGVCLTACPLLVLLLLHAAAAAGGRAAAGTGCVAGAGPELRVGYRGGHDQPR